MSWAQTLLLGALMVSSGCQTVAPDEDVPALIAEPTPQGHAELLRVVQDALNGTPVTIADDALTTNSLLIIQRMPPGDLENRPLTGRDLGRPEHFRLVLSGSRCMLVHEEKDRRWELVDARCTPES